MRIGDLFCVLELHLVLDSLYGQQQRVNFQQQIIGESGGICAYSEFVVSKMVPDLLTCWKGLFGKKAVRNFGGYPLCLM